MDPIAAPASPYPPARWPWHRRPGSGVGVLLALVAGLHLIYPFTIGTGTVGLVLYNVLYTAMFLAGLVVATDSRRHFWTALVTAAIWMAAAVTFSLDPTHPAKIVATYLALLPFQGWIIYILLRYIFTARTVTRDVLYAAVTVYVLLAALFTPVYGILEQLQPGSFRDLVQPGVTVFWQQLIYFSLVTLTTTGYGDIVPVTPWARAFANLEAVLGVLYLAILMARLVSLYQAERPGAGGSAGPGSSHWSETPSGGTPSP